MKYTPAGGYVWRTRDHIHHLDCVECGHHHAEDDHEHKHAPVVKHGLKILDETPKPKRKKKMAKKNPFVYHNVELVRVVDGDTVRFRVDVGFHMTFEENFRLADIDTPEVRGKEKVEGLRSKVAMEQMLAEEIEHGKGVKLQTYNEGKFGRWLATIISVKSGASLNQRMITEGYAKPYGS